MGRGVNGFDRPSVYPTMRITIVLLVSLLGSLALGQSPKPRILICPIEVQDRKALPEMLREETQKDIAASVERYIASKLFEGGAELVRAANPEKLLERLKGKAANGKETATSEYAAIAADAEVDAVLFIRLMHWDQKNRKPGEILAAPTKGGSETEVELRAWLFNAKERTLAADGRAKPWSTRIESPFFGTQKRGEMQGNPADEILFIKQINLKRIQAISKAAYETVRPSLASVLKLDLR
jgi:hypothetical protein